MNISNETKVGVFVVFILTVLILGYNYLKGKNIFSSTDTYYAIYDNAANISESNPVLLQGYKIGRISNIHAIQGIKTRIVISFTVKRGLKIPAHSRAKIISTDITGTKALQLIFSDSKKLTKPRDTLTGETELGISEAVDKIIAPIEQKLNKIMEGLQEVLNEEGVENLRSTLLNLKMVTQNLSNITASINTTMANDRLGAIVRHIENITNTLESNKDKINNILGNLSNFSDSLKAAPIAQTIKKINSISANLDQITFKINKGEGSLGLLVNNDSLYVNLAKASDDLDKLIIDLKAHPGRYVRVSVFGGKKK